MNFKGNFFAIDSRKSFDLALRMASESERRKKGLELNLASLKLLISVEVTLIFPPHIDCATHFLLLSRFMAFFSRRILQINQ